MVSNYYWEVLIQLYGDIWCCSFWCWAALYYEVLLVHCISYVHLCIQCVDECRYLLYVWLPKVHNVPTKCWFWALKICNALHSNFIVCQRVCVYVNMCVSVSFLPSNYLLMSSLLQGCPVFHSPSLFSSKSRNTYDPQQLHSSYERARQNNTKDNKRTFEAPKSSLILPIPVSIYQAPRNCICPTYVCWLVTTWDCCFSIRQRFSNSEARLPRGPWDSWQRGARRERRKTEARILWEVKGTGASRYSEYNCKLLQFGSLTNTVNVSEFALFLWVITHSNLNTQTCEHFSDSVWLTFSEDIVDVHCK